jgi:hypothetical protein
MMYSASYPPDFYRALYALVHAEFRIRKSASALRRAVARPWTVRRRHAHEAASLAWHSARLPLLQRRLDRLGERAAPARLPLFVPLASRQAAAIPTDQATLE